MKPRAALLSLLAALAGAIDFKDVSQAGSTVRGEPEGLVTVFSSLYGYGDAYRLQTRFMEVRETDVNGAPLNNVNHAFVFGEEERDTKFTFPSVQAITKIGNVSANYFKMNALFGKVGELDLNIYGLTEAGLAGPEADAKMASPGDVQLTFQAESWYFCGGDCAVPVCQCNNNLMGTYLEVDLEIMGYETATLENNQVKTGGGMILQLPTHMEFDGREYKFPSGFPRLETRDDKQVLVLRFPRFERTLRYDMLVTVDLTVADPTFGFLDWALIMLAPLLVVGVVAGILFSVVCRPGVPPSELTNKNVELVRKQRAKIEEDKRKKAAALHTPADLLTMGMTQEAEPKAPKTLGLPVAQARPLLAP